MDGVLILLWLLFLFVLLPFGVGFVVRRLWIAFPVWVALAALMAVSQSSANGLGQFWSVVVLLGAFGLPIVLLGATARSRAAARRRSG